MTSAKITQIAREAYEVGNPAARVTQLARETYWGYHVPARVSQLAREVYWGDAAPVRVTQLVRETYGSQAANPGPAHLTWSGGTPAPLPYTPGAAHLTWSGAAGSPVLNPSVFSPGPARMYWSGLAPEINSYTTPFDWLITVISQYQNSPILLQLLANMASYIDPVTNFDQFYNLIWNVNTAQGYGLDVWGRIVGVGRIINVPTLTPFLGFESAAPTVKPFGFGIWYDGAERATQNFRLTDTAYRTLIFAKALANICDGSIPAMNQILINLYGQKYGNVYVTDGANMTMTITFTNPPSSVDFAIISQTGVFPRPAGVALTVVT